VTVLRFQRNDQEYKTPLNLHLGGREIPVGLFLTTAVLGVVAIANLFTKQTATKYGIAFTIVLFITFTLSEKINQRRVQTEKKGLEQFNLDPQPLIGVGTLHARPGCVLVAVRDYRRMEHLKRVLEKTNLRKHDIVVTTVRQISTGAAEYDLAEDQIFSDYEKELFSHVVELAEKQGKPVELLEVQGVNPFDALVRAASTLQASRLVTGVSARMESEELARRIGQAWQALPEPRQPFSLEVISPDRPSIFVNLGPHPPRLWPEDVDLLHDIWLELSEGSGLGSRLHHRDVVGVALRRLQKDLHCEQRSSAVEDLQKDIRKS
jgi:hypothetical protein